jgi:hypothetical protein
MKTQFGASCFAIFTALGLAACSGQIGDDLGSGSNGSGDNQGNNTTTGGNTNNQQMPGDTTLDNGVKCFAKASVASARISLISDQQFINVVNDVFGVKLTGDISTVASANGEYNVSETTAVGTSAMAQGYLDAADKVAADTNFKPCGAGAVTAACMTTYLAQKLPFAWRRPVTSDEINTLITKVFNVGFTDSPARAVSMTMEAVLGSSNFLYKQELGDNPTATTGQTTLSPFEVAAGISFALTNSAPDAELWAKATDGSILHSDVLSSEVDRVMALQSARDNLQKKVSYYLFFEKLSVVNKDTSLFPMFNGIKDDLYQSAQMFLNDVLWKGTFTDLLTSRKLYANQQLAQVYGLPAVTGTSMVPVQTTGAMYNAGVLTHPALLATANKHVSDDDIVHRGLWGYYYMACGISLADPPANAASVFATLTGTPQQKAVKRDALPACGVCHAAFDPFGIVTENYDPIGRYRTVDPDLHQTIDPSATIKQIGTDIDGPVKDPADLAQKFLTGTRASNCTATILTKFTLDHNADVENSCDIQKAKQQFHADGSFPELFKAILTSPAYLTRDL